VAAAVQQNRIARLDQIHAIITDTGIDDATREGLQRQGIEVITAEPPL